MDAFEPTGELVVETGEYEVRNGEAYRYIARAGTEINTLKSLAPLKSTVPYIYYILMRILISFKTTRPFTSMLIFVYRKISYLKIYNLISKNDGGHGDHPIIGPLYFLLIPISFSCPQSYCLSLELKIGDHIFVWYSTATLTTTLYAALYQAASQCLLNIDRTSA